MPQSPWAPSERTPDSKLEADFDAPYKAWKADPTPEAADAMLGALKPVIDRGVSAYAPESRGPGARARARRIALDALERYDPAGGKLAPYLMSQFQGLRRYSAAQGRPISLPEQAALERGHLQRATAELRDQLSRDPSDAELADHTGLSVRRIAKVRGYRPGFSEGQAANFGGPDAEGGPYDPAVKRVADARAAAMLLYDDLEGVDQLILEHGLQLNGAPKLPLEELARRTNLTPGRISQRAARIQALLDELTEHGVG